MIAGARVADRFTTALVGPSPRIAIEYCGAGELVVFLHGMGGNRTNWYHQLPVAAGHFEACTWDARGYGGSDDYDGPFRPEDVAEDLLRVLDYMKADKAHLVGLSMGGRMSQEFWLHHPDRIATMTLVCTSPGVAHALSPEKIEEFLAIRRAPLLAGGTPRDIAEPLARHLVSPNAQPAAYGELVASVAALRKEPYLKAIDALFTFDRINVLSTVTVPTHLIFGADDHLTTPELARQMASRIPGGAKVSIIPDAGHLANIEQPAAFNAALMGFLLEQKAKNARSSAKSGRLQ